MKIGISLPVRELKDDLGAIREFAQNAEDLGYSHLRVPDQVIRKNSGHLHEPMMLLSYIAALTNSIELVPSVIVLPSRQTALFAKQATELDRLSEGRLRIGLGVGGSKEEYDALGMNFHNRGKRCDEQILLLQELWTKENISFHGNYETIDSLKLDPLPVQQPIPIWIGGRSEPSKTVINRIGKLADGWFVLCSPEQFPVINKQIKKAAVAAGRDAACIGTEAGVAVVGAREAEWKDRVMGWNRIGLSHLCIRTLGAELNPAQHLAKMKEAMAQMPI
tara:strand:- start:850 stop:1680 length:831 start_codon:yes stop_codon:yes gene_type:complete